MSGKSGSATPYLTRTRSPTENFGGACGFLGFGNFRFFFVAIVTSIFVIHILPDDGLGGQGQDGEPEGSMTTATSLALTDSLVMRQVCGTGTSMPVSTLALGLTHTVQPISGPNVNCVANLLCNLLSKHPQSAATSRRLAQPG